MLVSVIIPSYNRKALLLEAIDSVFQQSYHEFELIVVDDGSSDGTQQALAGMDLRYIYQENAGVSQARNTGAAAAKGEYLCFLDSDDRYAPDCLARKVAHASLSQAQLIGAGCSYFGDGSGEAAARPSITFEDLCVFTAFPGGTNNIFVERSLFEQVGGFDIRLRNSEDRDLLRRLAERGRISSVNAPLVQVRFHRGERGRSEP